MFLDSMMFPREGNDLRVCNWVVFVGQASKDVAFFFSPL